MLSLDDLSNIFVTADFSMALRFKSISALDKILDALIESRRRVFPAAPPIGEPDWGGG